MSIGLRGSAGHEEGLEYREEDYKKDKGTLEQIQQHLKRRQEVFIITYGTRPTMANIKEDPSWEAMRVVCNNRGTLFHLTLHPSVPLTCTFLVFLRASPYDEG